MPRLRRATGARGGGGGCEHGRAWARSDTGWPWAWAPSSRSRRSLRRRTKKHPPVAGKWGTLAGGSLGRQQAMPRAREESTPVLCSPCGHRARMRSREVRQQRHVEGRCPGRAATASADPLAGLEARWGELHALLRPGLRGAEPRGTTLSSLSSAAAALPRCLFARSRGPTEARRCDSLQQLPLQKAR